MPKRFVLEPLAAPVREAVLGRYNEAPDPETRSRLQMVLLSSDHGWNPAQIAPLVQRSHDVVYEVLSRFRAGGVDAVPRRTSPGKAPTITPAWEDELLRVIEVDPHTVGVASANWTTQALAEYLARRTAVAVDQETVRRHLHRLGYVCKRPTWTLEQKAHERDDYPGNACGWRSS
jgi:transposase